MKEFCGEIQYTTDAGNVHSDICFHSAYFDEPQEDFRQFLHDCLDEWLNKSNGTGAFWIGDPDYFKGWQEPDVPENKPKINKPELTPCIICKKEIKYLWGPETTFEATNLDDACDIEVYGAYGSRFDTMTYAATICDDCMDKLVQDKHVRFVRSPLLEED